MVVVVVVMVEEVEVAVLVVVEAVVVAVDFVGQAYVFYWMLILEQEDKRECYTYLWNLNA